MLLSHIFLLAFNLSTQLPFFPLSRNSTSNHQSGGRKSSSQQSHHSRSTSNAASQQQQPVVNGRGSYGAAPAAKAAPPAPVLPPQIQPDATLVPPIRQTASIFKQPVTVEKRPTVRKGK